jgi:hypothetical protein
VGGGRAGPQRQRPHAAIGSREQPDGAAADGCAPQSPTICCVKGLQAGRRAGQAVTRGASTRMLRRGFSTGPCKRTRGLCKLDLTWTLPATATATALLPTAARSAPPAPPSLPPSAAAHTAAPVSASQASSWLPSPDRVTTWRRSTTMCVKASPSASTRRHSSLPSVGDSAATTPASDATYRRARGLLTSCASLTRPTYCCIQSYCPAWSW